MEIAIKVLPPPPRAALSLPCLTMSLDTAEARLAAGNPDSFLHVRVQIDSAGQRRHP